MVNTLRKPNTPLTLRSFAAVYHPSDPRQPSQCVPCHAQHLGSSCASRSDRLGHFLAHADVYVVDPRTVLSPDKGGKLSSVQLELPQALLKQPPHFELGDADDPMSTWIFGERAEIFQYKFLGGVLCTQTQQSTLQFILLRD